ncbi:MAG: bacteriohemerythrin [Proteobacteria bacterium]|nr:bacteriohemerythrin [Pseudomonadota bacterium]
MEDRLTFDSRYVVGIDQIDREHQELFEIAGRIYDSISMDVIVPMNQVQAAIAELIESTKVHFSSEELLMESKAYPGLPEHRELHAYLISRIEDFEKSVALGEQLTPVDAYEFLCSWLGDHIQASDKNFGMYFSRQARSA